ncbi:MAG TPA: c-type cytochrome [Candidatus Acidoferrum sp.]|nr:c-type cytochrome [Candidatus Acidoferrum sp.]
MGTLIRLPSVFLFLAVVAIALGAQNKPGSTSSKTNAAGRAEAKSTFEIACASCHGLDARGGERAPDIASLPEVVRKTDAQLVKILTDGKIVSGMPSFASYGSARLSALVAYLRVLQGRSKMLLLPGDPARGKTLFLGKAKCAECHMISGQGGFLGQDLTSYAARMGVDDIRSSIVNPERGLDPRRGLVTVILTDSTTFSGIARNEDNFSLQLQTADGVFHLLNKSDIKDLTYTGKLPMPSDYGSTLSSQELNDLVSYMLATSRSLNGRKAPITREDGDEE